ncbi:MAG: HAMP domain-containing histidine kinase [Clostridiales bacterium]|jgi:signal transduction histidine kinase|nr:HAMP domain-containing histidine kinase [Clostridiales bacterium]
MKLLYRLLVYFAIDAAVFAFAFIFYPQGGAAAYMVMYCLILLLFNLVFFQIEHAVFLKGLKNLSDALGKTAKGDYKYRIAGSHRDPFVQKMSDNFNAMAAAVETLENTTESFISNTSHELRSPLASVQSFLTAVLDGTAAPAEREKYLSVALSETKKLSEIVGSMLDLSRLDAGNFHLNLEEFDLNALISESLLKFERKIQGKRIALHIDFYTEPCAVFADKTLIEQVIVNLVDNAIKYSPENAPLRVSTDPAGDRVALSVSDKGCGIDKEEQRLIFEKFYRVDKARTPGKNSGTGVGLALVKKIISMHGQTITVYSEPGEGSVFTFTLERC